MYRKPGIIKSFTEGLSYIYIATESAGIFRYSFYGNQFEYPITQAQGLSSNQVSAIHFDRMTGILWVANEKNIEYSFNAEGNWISRSLDNYNLLSGVVIEQIGSSNNLGQGDIIAKYTHHTLDPTTPGGAGEVFKIYTYSANANGADYSTWLYKRAGSAGGECGIRLGGSADGSINFYTSPNSSTAYAERLRITSDGKIGIGNNAPSWLLHLQQSSGTTTLGVKNTGGHSTVYVEASSGNTAKLNLFQAGTSGYSLQTGSTDALQIFRDSTYFAQFDSSGRFMIGTTTEGRATYGEHFTIAGSGHCGMTIRSGSSSDGNIYFSDGDDGSAAEVRGFVEYNHTSNYMQLGTDGSARIRIGSGGLVGINTNTIGTNHNLEIFGNAGAYAVLNVKSQSLSHGACLELGAQDDDDYGQITQFASGAGEGARMKFVAGATETMNLRGGKVLIGATSNREIAGGHATLQVEKNSSEGISLTRTTDDAGAIFLSLGKVRSGGSNSGRCVADDNIGSISWNPSDGTDLNHAAAEIQAPVSYTHLTQPTKA